MNKNDLIDNALSALDSDLNNVALDEYEIRGVLFIKDRLTVFKDSAYSSREKSYPGELSRIVQEFDPSKISPDTGGLIIKAEKAFFSENK